MDSGSQTVIVSVTGASTALVNTTYNISGNTKYSYVIFGPQTAVGAQLLADSFNDPGDGFFALRLVNAAAGPGALDLYRHRAGCRLDRHGAGGRQRHLRLEQPVRHRSRRAQVSRFALRRRAPRT